MGVPYEERQGEEYRPDDLEEVADEIDLETEEVLDSFGNRVDEEYVAKAVEDARRRVGRPLSERRGPALPASVLPGAGPKGQDLPV